MVASIQGSTGILMRQRGFVNFCSRAKSKVQYLIFFANALPTIAKISSGSQIEHRKVTIGFIHCAQKLVEFASIA